MMKEGKESQPKLGQQQEKTVKPSQERKRRKQVFINNKKGLNNVISHPQFENGKMNKQRETTKEKQVPDRSTKPELDAEIEEIAKKIKEANTQKMTQIKNCSPFHANQPAEMTPQNKISEDWTSIQGQFGWTELYNTTIPYLTRSGRKYVCLRMAENKIFFVYRQYFSDEIRNCYRVEKLKITKAEADLLNEINFRHCDNFFGRIEFTINDEIVALDDVKEMYDFLDFCYTRLVEKNPIPHKRCGFIRIAAQNCVPYVWHKDRQYVPLFYFEGECKYLEERSRELRGWELAYLKLACKIQGIRKSLFDEELIRVVETDLVKKFFPPDTLFEWMWLVDYNVDSFVQKPLLRIVHVEPDQVANKKRLCVDKPLVQKKIQVKSTLQKMPAQRETPQSVGDKRANPVASSKNTCFNQYMSIPSPLTNGTIATGVQLQYQKPGTVYVSKPTSGVSYKQTQALRPVSLPNRSKVLQIPDFVCNSTAGCPYFLVRSQVEDKQLNCMNMEPYTTTILMVTLEEVATVFYGFPMEPVVNAINVMRLDVYLPNKLQIRYLERSNKYPTVGFIKLKDFIDNIPQVRYILSS